MPLVMLALVGCYIIIAFGTLGLVSEVVERDTGCAACGFKTPLTRLGRWLIVATFAAAWPLFWVFVAVEVAATLRRHDDRDP